MDEPIRYSAYIVGTSRRNVAEVTCVLAAQGEPDVIYSLYTQAQRNGRRLPWWQYRRKGRCRLSTWMRWAKNATIIQSHDLA